jgi:AraC-like DNA-binding protein
MPTQKSSAIMHEQVQLPGGSPIKVKWNHIPHFTFPWHFHPEYEIIYIIESSGKRFIGDSMEIFSPGDLILIGSQVPHFFKSDNIFHQQKTDLEVNAIIIQFTQSFLHEAIENYPELHSIRELLKKAQQGICIKAPANREITKKIEQLYYQKGFARFMGLIDILHQMSQSPERYLLSTETTRFTQQTDSTDRFHKLLHHINKNYQQTLTLEDTASRFGMNTSAFSRYFKQKTGQSFIHYINNMRIAYACKLLQGGKYSVSQACFECGFNNISNFNRFFKEIMKMTPSEYLKQLG